MILYKKRKNSLAKNGLFFFILVCQNVEAGTEPGSPPMRMIAVTYVYMINKYIEFADTFFMVFKKKNNQVYSISFNISLIFLIRRNSAHMLLKYLIANAK